MKHLALCVMVRGRREGFVLSGPTFSALERWADTFKTKVGYVGEDDFQVAVKRAGMMERDEVGAWGPLADASTYEAGRAFMPNPAQSQVAESDCPEVG